MGKRASRVFFMVGTVISAILSICFAIHPNPALSDFKDIQRYTSYEVQDAHTVIFYDALWPIASFGIPYCYIRPKSKVRPVKSYVCDGDKMIIDGEPFTIMSVSSPSTQFY